MSILSRFGASPRGRSVLAVAAGATLLLSATPVAQAAALSSAQVGAVTALLSAFGVDAGIIANVQAELSGSSVSTGSATSTSAVSDVTIGYLHKGDSGQGVCYLHALLAADPTISATITAEDTNGDCPFGPVTESAVKQFQSEHGIAAVGFIGPQTLAALKLALADHPLGREDDSEGHGRVCAIIPPGHLVAPGWLRHHDGERPVVPTCQTLPPGIKEHMGEGTTTPPGADTTPPVISSVSASSAASTTATVSWTTDEAATSKVYYTSDSALDLASASHVSSSSLVTSHALDLSGLTASTTYQYLVESDDAAGNVATSSTSSFTTGS